MRTPPTSTTATYANGTITITTQGDTTETVFHRDRQQAAQAQQALAFEYINIIISTSSLIQLAHSCPNLTSLDLSGSTILYDSMLAETGEYISTLQHYAPESGFTQIQIDIGQVIETLGRECPRLEDVTMHRCEWVTAKMIWLWAVHCPKLRKLDAKWSTKCTVKRLVACALIVPPPAQSSTVDLPSLESQGEAYEGATLMRQFLIDHGIFDDEEALVAAVEAGNAHPLSEFLRNGELLRNICFRFHPRDRRLQFRYWPPTGHGWVDIDLPFRRAWMQQQQQQQQQEQQQLHHDMVEARDPGDWVFFDPQRHPYISRSGMQINARSLRELVFRILKDAKDAGAMDLAWLPDEDT